jgi:SulP family sulfate permease
VIILAAILIMAPLLGLIPMASLAALLLLVAWNMSDVGLVVHTLRVAPRSDVAVLVTCYTLTVAFDMVIAVSVGVVLASLLFMRRMAEVTRGRLTTGTRSQLPIPIPKGVLLYDIDGPLFFGAAQKAMAALQHITDNSSAVILRLEDVPVMDATGLVALESALDQLHRRKCMAYLVGLQPQPRMVIQKAGLPAREGVVVCADISEALRLAGRS